MKKLMLLLIFILTIITLYRISSIYVFGSQTLVDVGYDDCVADSSGDSEQERWYYLNESYYSRGPSFLYYHLPTDKTTITYYFSECAKDDVSYTWTTDVTVEIANEIKTAFANSMEKWNNVYFFQYDIYGNRTSKKIINVVEGTETNHDLTIYPAPSSLGAFAVTQQEGSYTTVYTGASNIEHRHYENWFIQVNIDLFYVHAGLDYTAEKVAIRRERTGEHELGHILGLDDIDECCTEGIGDHHEELLMGYGLTLNRVKNATYKDIAGVAITRGFHTDNDHIWMRRDNGETIDMICAICNGVKHNVELDSGGLTYQGKAFTDFEDCIHHGHTNSNMLLVAKDSDRYFFKCLYCRHIETIEIDDNLYVYNNLQPIARNIAVEGNKTKYYKLNISFNKYYEINANGTTNVNVKLYDENFNEIPTTDIKYSSSACQILQYLNAGTYYLEINNMSYANNSISFGITSMNQQYLTINEENDILLNTYNGITEYNYFNESGPGFYKFKLTATNINGSTYVYSSQILKVYNDSSRFESSLMNKYDYIDYNGYNTNKAVNKNNEDYIIVYLPSNGYYYLDIDVSSTNLASLSIEISSLSIDELDLFGFSENSNDDEFVLEEEHSGDYFIKLKINQTGYFGITASYDGDLSPYILVLIVKITYDENLHAYTRDEILKEEFNKNDSQATTETTLTEGIYYIGFFNKSDDYELSINFERVISQSGSSRLVADTYDYDDYGSEVRFNNGLRGGTTLTVGFTRFIYLDDPSNVPSISRLNYYWYTSDEELATISEYGTLLAKSIGTVKVMAVYKNDPSITYVREFTILADNRVGNLIIYDTATMGYAESGQLYQIELDDYNSYFPQISLYNWTLISSANNHNYTISEWGTFYLSGSDVIVIEATSKLNSKLKIRITLTVTL